MFLLACLLEGKSQFLLPRISDIRQLSGKLSIFNFFPLMCQKYYIPYVGQKDMEKMENLYSAQWVFKRNNVSGINNVHIHLKNIPKFQFFWILEHYALNKILLLLFDIIHSSSAIFHNRRKNKTPPKGSLFAS